MYWNFLLDEPSSVCNRAPWKLENDARENPWQYSACDGWEMRHSLMVMTEMAATRKNNTPFILESVLFVLSIKMLWHESGNVKKKKMQFSCSCKGTALFGNKHDTSNIKNWCANQDSIHSSWRRTRFLSEEFYWSCLTWTCRGPIKNYSENKNFSFSIYTISK